MFWQARNIVKDDRDEIQAQIKSWAGDEGIDIIISTGGTGFTGRDVTPESVEPLFDKRMDGFSIIFQHISYEKIGTSTIQSRATAGLIGNTFVFLPAGLAWSLQGCMGRYIAGTTGLSSYALQFRGNHASFG